LERLTVAEAARACGRSVGTVRRWLREGALTRHEGPLPAHGGSPVVLVDLAEMHALVVASGRTAAPRAGAVEAELVGALRADLAAQRERADALALAVDRLRDDVRDARAERDAWRDAAERAGAEAAELRRLLTVAEREAREAVARLGEERRPTVSRWLDAWRGR
jgi:hypothetical protein